MTNGYADETPILIRVVALDVAHGAVRGFATQDVEVRPRNTSNPSARSWRFAASAATDLGDPDAALLRGLALRSPRPDALAAFGPQAWEVLSPAVVGDVALLDVRTIAWRVWPDVPSPQRDAPKMLLAGIGIRSLHAGLTPQGDLALAEEVEAAARLLGFALLGNPAFGLPDPLTGADYDDGGRDDMRDQLPTLVALSAGPESGSRAA